MCTQDPIEGSAKPGGKIRSFLTDNHYPSLQAGINMAGSTAFRGVAADVDEFTLPAAFRADLRGSSGRDSEAALAALPIGQTTVRAYISHKFTRSRIATMGADPFFLCCVHLKYPFRPIDQVVST